MRWLAPVALVLFACVPQATGMATPSPMPASTTSAPPTATRTDPVPSFPANVTYAGWVIVDTVRGDLITVTATMGSPPVLQGRVLILRGHQDGLLKGACVLVEFVAQVEPDGTHRLVSVDLNKRPTNDASCRTPRS